MQIGDTVKTKGGKEGTVIKVNAGGAEVQVALRDGTKLACRAADCTVANPTPATPSTEE